MACVLMKKTFIDDKEKVSNEVIEQILKKVLGYVDFEKSPAFLKKIGDIIAKASARLDK